MLPRLDLDDWSVRGFFSPERGRVVLSQFQLRAGGAEVSAEGDVTDMAGAMQARLDGKIGPMPASIFKTLWPAPLAPEPRLGRQAAGARLARRAAPFGSPRPPAAAAGWAAPPAPSAAR